MLLSSPFRSLSYREKAFIMFIQKHDVMEESINITKLINMRVIVQVQYCMLGGDVIKVLAQ